MKQPRSSAVRLGILQHAFWMVLIVSMLFPMAVQAALAGDIMKELENTEALGYAVGKTVDVVLSDDGKGSNRNHDYISYVFTQVTKTLHGRAGKALCTLAVLVAGVGALFGRISWIQALTIAGGIAVVFGTSSVVAALDGHNDLGGTIASGAKVCDDPVALFATSKITLPLNRVCDMLRRMIVFISGGTGATIASVGVLIVGLAALFGKISLPQAITVALGVGLLFGAVNLIDIFWVNNQDCFAGLVQYLSGGPEFLFCRFLDELHSSGGKFFATLAVIILGVLTLIGRVSWQLGATVVVGMTLVYGSDTFVELLAPTGKDCLTFYTLPVITWSNGAIEGVMCQILHLLTGTLGKALASSAVVMLGFGAMLGKVSYPAAFIVAVGISIAFGAPQIVFLLTGMVDFCALSIDLSVSAAPLKDLACKLGDHL